MDRALRAVKAAGTAVTRVMIGCSTGGSSGRPIATVARFARPRGDTCKGGGLFSGAGSGSRSGTLSPHGGRRSMYLGFVGRGIRRVAGVAQSLALLPPSAERRAERRARRARRAAEHAATPGVGAERRPGRQVEQTSGAATGPWGPFQVMILVQRRLCPTPLWQSPAPPAEAGLSPKRILTT